jgi:hypothetical protein
MSSSVIDLCAALCKALGSIPSTEKKMLRTFKGCDSIAQKRIILKIMPDKHHTTLGAILVLFRGTIQQRTRSSSFGMSIQAYTTLRTSYSHTCRS